MIITKKNIVDYLEQDPQCNSVSYFIEKVCSITKKGDIHITKEGDTIELISNKSNANNIGGEAISAIVLALNILEELSNKGCVVVYQMNKNDQIVIGNSNIKESNRFTITNDIILKYIDKELLVTDELQNFKERGYLSLNDYNNAESLRAAQHTLKVSQHTLNVSKINLWVAIGVAIAGLILKCICQ